MDKRSALGMANRRKRARSIKVIEAKVPLKAKINEITRIFRNSYRNRNSNLYKLDLNVHYSKAEHLELINAAVIEGKSDL